MTAADHRSTLRVHRIEWAAEGILEVDLRDPAGADLPAFTAGAHVDLVLPNGITRSYSLANDPVERHRFVLGIGLDPASRGGSRHVHRDLRVGELLTVLGPRNHFPLDETVAHSVLIAGGIGITPMAAMASRLAHLGRSFEFHYAVRDPSRAAFLDRVRGLAPRFALHVDAEVGRPLDIAAIVAAAPAGAHFYCCGPLPMLAAYEAATAGLPPERVHLEYFKAKPVEAAAATGFEIEIAGTGRVLEVPPEKSIADVLEAAGVKTGISCQEGICGSCEVKVVAGEPDHRDQVLTAAEKASGRTMMICVSRSKSPRLVIELA
ncbi:MAG: PDR/VanB family oxidoreductase [Siculibacillus sp.]|nr:PDR/VanB family oxidoreductase [Siculibacillus sp.]